jgi:hypothetical protein
MICRQKKPEEITDDRPQSGPRRLRHASSSRGGTVSARQWRKGHREAKLHCCPDADGLILICIEFQWNYCRLPIVRKIKTRRCATSECQDI